MSSTIKFGLLAFISTAAAVPHYGHNRHHHKGGKGTASLDTPVYPTGGFNDTAAPYPTGAGTGTGSHEPATTINTAYLTQTLVSTIYETKTGALALSSVLPLDVTAPAACAPETVRITATEKVTVTVSAAGPSGTAPIQSEVKSEAPAPPATSEVSSLIASLLSSINYETVAPFPTSVDYGLGESSIVVPKLSSTSEVAATTEVTVPTTSVVVDAVSSVVASPAASSAASYGKRVPQDWSDPSLYAGVNWDEINYNQPAPAPAPVPAPAPPPSPEPAPEPEPAPAPEPAPEPAPVENKPTDPAPEPVSKPVSSDGASYSGKKRGLAYNDLNLCQSFSSEKIGFAYNWAQAENGDLPDGIQFIPMMHKTSDSSAEAFLSNVDAAVEKGTTAVMTFNEPDHAEQANMSPEAACAAWSSYIQPITSSHPNVEIMSPSVTNGPAPMGLDWLSRFQKNCPDATWHSANIHFYDIYDDQTFDRFKAHVELAISTFNKPIWITEFGLNPGAATPEQAADFLGKAVSYLDGNASVKGYAWFMVGTDTSFNMLNTGNGLSTTGQIYASS